MAFGVAVLQGTAPAMEQWLWVTGQDVCIDKSYSWVHGEEGVPVALLRGHLIPMVDTFRPLGINVAIRGSWVTGPMLAKRLDVARSSASRTSPPLTAVCGRSTCWSRPDAY